MHLIAPPLNDVILKVSIVIHQPLSSNEQSKILIFSFLLAPSVALLVGAIPALLLAFGIFMMKRNRNFSNVEAAVRGFKGYVWIAILGCSVSSIYFGDKYFNEEDRWHSYGEALVFSLTFGAIAFAYLVLVHILFLSPLKAHSQWVEINGIFSSREKGSSQDAKSEVDIIKGEKLKSYSVADELLRWATLKENGHISEEEYIDARKKLLKRN